MRARNDFAGAAVGLAAGTVGGGLVDCVDTSVVFVLFWSAKTSVIFGRAEVNSKDVWVHCCRKFSHSLRDMGRSAPTALPMESTGTHALRTLGCWNTQSKCRRAAQILSLRSVILPFVVN